jgi:hypothetical protein
LRCLPALGYCNCSLPVTRLLQRPAHAHDLLIHAIDHLWRSRIDCRQRTPCTQAGVQSNAPCSNVLCIAHACNQRHVTIRTATTAPAAAGGAAGSVQERAGQPMGVAAVTQSARDSTSGCREGEMDGVTRVACTPHLMGSNIPVVVYQGVLQLDVQCNLCVLRAGGAWLVMRNETTTHVIRTSGHASKAICPGMLRCQSGGTPLLELQNGMTKGLCRFQRRARCTWKMPVPGSCTKR